MKAYGVEPIEIKIEWGTAPIGGTHPRCAEKKSRRESRFLDSQRNFNRSIHEHQRNCCGGPRKI